MEDLIDKIIENGCKIYKRGDRLYDELSEMNEYLWYDFRRNLEDLCHSIKYSINEDCYVVFIS